MHVKSIQLQQVYRNLASTVSYTTALHLELDLSISQAHVID